MADDDIKSDAEGSAGEVEAVAAETTAEGGSDEAPTKQPEAAAAEQPSVADDTAEVADAKAADSNLSGSDDDGAEQSESEDGASDDGNDGNGGLLCRSCFRLFRGRFTTAALGCRLCRNGLDLFRRPLCVGFNVVISHRVLSQLTQCREIRLQQSSRDSWARQMMPAYRPALWGYPPPA